MKRLPILTALAALILLLCCLLPTKAHAATVSQGTCGDKLTWTLDDVGTLTISGSGLMDHYNYFSDTPWSNKQSAIRAVVIENGVGSVADRAFYGCANLSSVTFPKSVIRIGAYAFYGCSSLTVVEILGEGISFDVGAFQNCGNLERMVLPNSIGSIADGIFSNCNKLAYNVYDNANYIGSNSNPYLLLVKAVSADITSCTIHEDNKVIGSRAFALCRQLTDITIPNGVQRIDASAFSNCSKLSVVNLPESVIQIGRFAFEQCRVLTEISVPNNIASIGQSAFSGCGALTYKIAGGVKYLGNASNPYLAVCGVSYDSSSYSIHKNAKIIADGAFYDCEYLTDVSIPDGVTVVGDCAFEFCRALKSVAMPNSVTAIGGMAFYGCSALQEIFISESVTEIEEKVFYDCSSLLDIVIPAGVTTIGEGAFQGCSALSGVSIGSNVIQIGKSAFANCNSLAAIVIPDSVTSIGEAAFSGCLKLEEVTLSHSLTRIPNSLFRDCSSLRNITLPNGVTGIGSNAFNGCSNLLGVTIPDSVTKIGSSAFSNCKSLVEITLHDGITSIGSSAFMCCKSLTEIAIPKGISSINSSAFYACSGLTTVKISDGVISIGSNAFKDCGSLTQIAIPDSVATINSYAFSGCCSLTSAYIPAGVASIGSYAFEKCSSLEGIWVSADNAHFVNDARGVLYNKDKTILLAAPGTISGVYCIPEGIIQIGTAAFSYCGNLTDIAVPDSITSIQYAAFRECGNLAHIAYEGTEAQWNTITVASNNTHLTSASKFHYETAFHNVDTCAETSVYCPVCEEFLTRTEWTEANPNPNLDVHIFEDATCTAPMFCVTCGATRGEALGHSGDRWFEIIPTTCVIDGLKARICSVCGTTETVPISALGHSYNAVVTVPTCTEKGYTTKTCATCGEISVTDYVDALGHSYSAVVVEPTCTEQGYTTKTCATCGDVTTEYVPAKGHSWSAWITTVKPTCTTEGARMHFCNCGTRETEVIAKLPHSFENEVCTVCGRSEYFRMTLTEDTQTNLTLEQDLYVDLNGFDLSGTIITNGYKVYGKDSTTDSYSCENMGSFTCVDENGDFIVPERIYTEDEKQYMTICEEDRYSFHRFFVGITHMTLAPETAGLGYKTAVYGDEMVFSQLDAFTFQVQLEGYNPVYRHFGNSELASGEPITLRIRNYDVENYSEHNLYAQVSLTLNDGTVIETDQVALTFRWLAEQVSANHTDYTNEQITQFKAMLQAFDIVKKWNIPNLI